MESNSENINNIILEPNEKKSKNNNSNEKKEKNNEKINNIYMGINNTNKILSKRNNYLTSTNKIIKIDIFWSHL